MPEPTTFYIITGTRRCGSSLLCDLLGATHIAGMPHEFFSRWLLRHWIHVWQLPPGYSAELFVATALRIHTSPNGVHGVKLFYDHLYASPFTTLAAQRGLPPEAALRLYYPGAQYIHLSRRDLRGQALSYYRALQTDVWFASAPGQRLAPVRLGVPDTPPLNPAKVLECERDICHEEQSWAQFYQRQRITPLRLIYEDLIANMPFHVARVLAWLHLDPQAAYQTPPPRLRQQRDALTQAWRVSMRAYAPEHPNPYIKAPS